MSERSGILRRVLCCVLVGAVLCAVAALGGCNTVGGFGRDIQTLGGYITGASD